MYTLYNNIYIHWKLTDEEIYTAKYNLNLALCKCYMHDDYIKRMLQLTINIFMWLTIPNKNMKLFSSIPSHVKK